jgi:hypothetical protein
VSSNAGTLSGSIRFNFRTLVYAPTAVMREAVNTLIHLIRRIRHAVLLWHLPLVILFGSWDVAVSTSEQQSAEARFDAQSAVETPEFSSFRDMAN